MTVAYEQITNTIQFKHVPHQLFDYPNHDMTYASS